MQALQVCEESGTDLAQRVLKETRKSKKDAASRSGQSAVSLASGAPLGIDLPHRRMCPLHGMTHHAHSLRELHLQR